LTNSETMGQTSSTPLETALRDIEHAGQALARATPAAIAWSFRQ
jgi:hypothetical protein